MTQSNLFLHTCPMCGRTFYDDEPDIGQGTLCEECTCMVYNEIIEEEHNNQLFDL